ncbi:hypothetical protein Ocin01_00371 [Orchesella cincta]|uniref:Uncharacterized protein n=1 Tax=Orchesella cincta TaxID=48709 RepID=A0A1D2NM41_ORCCI|nr:hypothetical protein Ocin01_00371 [Orchesella cincta]
MHSVTVFLGFCLALTVALALPSPQIQHGESKASESHRLRPVRANLNDQQLKSVITLRHLATLQPRDWFSDLIRETLNLTVKELLAKTEETFKALDRVTNGGLQQLKQVLELATPEEQTEINKIINSTIGGILNQSNEFLKDLGLVLPNISSMKATRYDAAADIILALLGVSLEELIIAIANAMECSLDLIDRAIIDLTALAQQAGPNVAGALTEISVSFKNEGANWLIPMVDQLHQLVSSTGGGCTRSRQTNPVNIQGGDDMLAKTVSLMLGIRIKTAAFQAEDAFPKLVKILESTRDILERTLAPEVQTKVMAIYDNAIDDVIRQAKPIFETLLQFQEPARRDHAFVYNLLNSVLGIGLDNFKNYLRFASNQIESTIKTATTEMFVASISGGIMPALDVWKILHGKLIAAKLVSKPLRDTLKPLLDSPEEEYADGSDEWSNPDGALYNRDALINTVSMLLNFNVSDATRELKIALQGLDSLMEASLHDLDQILPYEEMPHLRSEILGIMNNTLTEIHIALQPMFDVLLPFLPDTTRSNRDIALNIYTAINRLDGTQFLSYCSLTSTKIPLLTSEATYLIQTAASKASSEVQRDLLTLLQRSDEATDVILKPFLDSLGHIITPF